MILAVDEQLNVVLEFIVIASKIQSKVTVEVHGW
jgi:hypothetical protein